MLPFRLGFAAVVSIMEVADIFPDLDVVVDLLDVIDDLPSFFFELWMNPQDKISQRA